MQQTRVDQGLPYWERFIAKFPTVHDLAQASEEEVLQLWSGLGYYSRARNLHASAKKLSKLKQWPKDRATWLSLPGVGPYTASAITSICFGERIPALDGNALRVYSRLFAYPNPVDKIAALKHLEERSTPLIHPGRPGDSNQAIMDLGSSICTPTNPSCSSCPLGSHCEAHQRGTESLFPIKTSKKGAISMTMTFYITNCKDEIALVKRPGKGIWAGLWCFPEDPLVDQSYVISLEITHLLSHRKLLLQFMEFSIPEKTATPPNVKWVRVKDLSHMAIPVPIRWWLQEKNYI